MRTGGLTIIDRLSRQGPGNDEAGQRFASLQISPTPVTALSYLDHGTLVPAAPQSKRACADYVGYEGLDRIHGHYTVTYATIGTLELQPQSATTIR